MSTPCVSERTSMSPRRAELLALGAPKSPPPPREAAAARAAFCMELEAVPLTRKLGVGRCCGSVKREFELVCGGCCCGCCCGGVGGVFIACCWGVGCCCCASR